MDCPLCGCLGLANLVCKEADPPMRTRSSPVRERQELKQSAEAGCQFCGMVLQASQLLRTAAQSPSLQIEISGVVATEVSSSLTCDPYDSVEIFAVTNRTDKRWPYCAREPPKHADSDMSFQFLHRNYTNCMQGHPQCCVTSDYLPTRLIDISGPIYRLVEPEPTTTGLYVALSYCWGEGATRILKNDNLELLKQQLPWDEMPVCFKDAAHLARKLEIPYLWIDSICILQDCSDDWLRESGRMAEVYKNATLVIAAATSPSPQHSFLVDRDTYYDAITLEHEAGFDKSLKFKARRRPNSGLHARVPKSGPRDPLALRAWALQEQELATRYISFGQAGLQWQCHQLSACECHPTNWAPSKALVARNNDSTIDKTTECRKRWYRLVEEYSSRRLTFSKDKFPAISGLAKEFRIHIQSEYIAGMWRAHLLSDISWQRHGRSVLQTATTGIAPSFSWASIQGEIDYQPLRESYPGERIFFSKIVNMEYSTKNENPWGEVKHNELSVFGPTILAQLRARDVADAQSYTLVIGNDSFEPNTFQRARCEFSVDTMLTSTKSSGERLQKEAWLTRATHSIAGVVEISGQVRLLSLYSLVHDEYIYDVFLILGISKLMETGYERIGIGTGKSYFDVGNRGQARAKVCPFYWLNGRTEGVDLGLQHEHVDIR